MRRDLLMLQIKKLSYPLTFLLITAFIFASCSSGEKIDSSLVATWDDSHSLSTDDFKTKLISMSGSVDNAKRQSLDWRFSQLNSYVNEQLLLEEARLRGIDKRTTILNCCEEQIHTLQMKEEEARDQEANEQIVKILVKDRVMTEERVKDFWEHDQFEMRARHLLVYMPPEIVGEDTLAYWQKIQKLDELVKTGKNFNALIDKYSDDKPKGGRRHGDLGFFRWGQMVDEFQDAVWALEPEQISEPVKSQFGYHIIQLIDKRSLKIQFDISHVLIACRRKSDVAETTLAYERAMMVLQKAREEGVDFAELARAHSEDKETWTNGHSGFKHRGTLDDNLWEALQGMKAGELNGPIRTSVGYHIIKLHEVKKEEIPFSDPDEKVRITGILRELHKEELAQAGQAFADSIFRAYDVAYSQDGLNFFCSKVNTPEMLDNIELDRLTNFSEDDLKTIIVEDRLRSLTIGDFAKRYQAFPLPAGELDEDRVKNEIVELYLWELYFKDIAKNLNLYTDPEVIEAQKWSSENVIKLELDFDILQENVHPTEEEIEAYYKKHFLKGQIPELVEPLENIHREISDDVRYEKLDETRANFLKTLRKKFDLRVNSKAVEEIWPIIEPLPQESIDERLGAVKERRRIGKEAKQRRKEANEIQMQLTPGKTQTFMRDGKEIKVKVGEPRPATKKDKNEEPTSRVKQSKSGQSKQVIELKPKKIDK